MKLKIFTGKRREVRRRVRRQPPRQVSPSRCDGRRDDDGLLGVHGGGAVQGYDASWARDVSVPADASPFDVLGRVWARDLYRRAELPSRDRRELHLQGREP